jgi:hypothetical protein
LRVCSPVLLRIGPGSPMQKPGRRVTRENDKHNERNGPVGSRPHPRSLRLYPSGRPICRGGPCPCPAGIQGVALYPGRWRRAPPRASPKTSVAIVGMPSQMVLLRAQILVAPISGFTDPLTRVMIAFRYVTQRAAMTRPRRQGRSRKGDTVSRLVLSSVYSTRNLDDRRPTCRRADI